MDRRLFLSAFSIDFNYKKVRTGKNWRKPRVKIELEFTPLGDYKSIPKDEFMRQLTYNIVSRIKVIPIIDYSNDKEDL